MRPSGPRPTLSPFKREDKQVIKPFVIRQSPEDNKYSVLASLPKTNPGIAITPFPALPNMANSPSKTGSSSSLTLKSPFMTIQTPEKYAHKTPGSFAEAVNPNQVKTPLTPREKEAFEFSILQVSPIFALDKDYENFPINSLIRPLFTNRNFVETDNPLKTRRYYEFILVDTGSVEIEHQLKDTNDPDSISYSKFTIKKVYSPFAWLADHLLTPINLSKEHRPQTFNWYDYRNAWFNFLFLRPNTHTWFVKYGPELARTTLPRWFYEWWSAFGGNTSVLPKTFRDKYIPFQTEQEISSLPEHIKLCKFFISKRISYIITWKFAVHEFDRIKYLSKEILVKGWTPAPKEVKQTVGQSSSSQKDTKPSKEELRKRLQKALDDIDSKSGEAILRLLEDASSQSDDNGDMLCPKGIAQAYLDHDPDYES